jgi:alpha-amylase
VKEKEYFDYYFDNSANKEIFLRACRKCYLPSNQILLDQIQKHKGEKKQVKVSFSISGVFLEQCEMFNKDVLETFKQLAETGCVEFLNQTYYHSVSSLYSEKQEFIEQVKQHQQITRDLLGFKGHVFENTELLYNNAVAKTVEKLGYKGIFTEGTEKILHEKSPNFLYAPKNGKKLKILLRNYKLTDDIGFRFSARWWSEWPLTADKYANWLAATPGQVINIFPDYETFGEHHWPETGIHEFLEHLPNEILKWWHLRMSTPSEVCDKYASSGEIDVPEMGGTISWADLERDASSWLGNTMQWAYYTSLKRLDPIVKESGDRELLRIWRYFQISDHLYYMFTVGGAPGEVHSYFSPYNSPIDAFVGEQSAILDFESRIRLICMAANEPFLFYTGVGKDCYTGITAWSLSGMKKAILEASAKSVEFHNNRGDFEKWAEESLHDEALSKKLSGIKSSGLKGGQLKSALARLFESRFTELRAEIQYATQYF